VIFIKYVERTLKVKAKALPYYIINKNQRNYKTLKPLKLEKIFQNICICIPIYRR